MQVNTFSQIQPRWVTNSKVKRQYTYRTPDTLLQAISSDKGNHYTGLEKHTLVWQVASFSLGRAFFCTYALVSPGKISGSRNAGSQSLINSPSVDAT